MDKHEDKDRATDTNDNRPKFDVILQQVGEFGFYQKRLLLLVCLTGGYVIMHNNAPVFTMTVPKHRCKLPDYPNDTYEVQSVHHAWLINYTIPRTAKGSYQDCSLYDVTPPEDGATMNMTLSHCDQWVYDRSVFSETLASELNLVCDRKIHRSTANMMIFAGKFVGAFLSSVCGDQFGRRRVYFFMLLSMLGSAIGMVFTTSLPLLLAFRFLLGATTTGCYLSAYVIGMELMGKSQRQHISLSFKISEIVMSLLGVVFASWLRDWSNFQAALAATCLPVVIAYFFIPESPRWLVSKGRLEEAQKIMDNIAHTNGAPPPPRLDNHEEKLQTSPRASAFGLFRYPCLLLRYTLLYCCWILVVMCIYGLMLNVSNMSGDIFVNVTMMTSVDVLSLLFYVLTIERFGRRLVLVVSSAVGGLACLATILPTVLGGDDWIFRGLSIVGRWFMSVSFMAIYVISPELFPTVMRSFGLGSCSMLARIGGLASPYVADLNTYVTGAWGQALPQIVFGASGVVTSAMMAAMPETKGRHLPETVLDAVHFGRNKSQCEDEVQPLNDTVNNRNNDCHREKIC